MSSSKKQKGLESDHEMDHISKLPDALLCHILSFVSTKSAVSTSVLSRRWISIWTKVSVLDFTKLPRSLSYRDCEQKKFVRFMANVLLHNDVSCLQRFHFEIYRDIESIHVKPWIDSILRREIWDIYLNKEWYGPSIFMRLPMDLFARETLKVLKLSGTFEINVPSSLHLPKLETLYLHESRFVGKHVIKILTSGCPVLKELIIKYCEGIKELFIDSLTLNKLKICNKSQIIFVKAPNVRYLDLDVRGSRYEVSNLSSLVEARICLGDYEPWKLEFIRRISDVQTLWLSQSTVELFGHFSENELPMFLNLTRLDIEIEHSMFQMLKCAPKLTRLSVNGNRTLKDNAALFPSEIVPHCISSIPNIEIRDFYCLENDTELVRYVLKNATMLKELKLHMHRVSLKRERDAFKKLLSFPRVSFCEVIICSSCESEKLPLHFSVTFYT